MAWAGDENSICVVPEIPAGMPSCCAGRCVVAVDKDHHDAAITFQPWGWNQAAMKLAALDSTMTFNAPDLAAVRKVNSRSFLNGFDDVVNLQNGKRHRFSNLCRSFDELTGVIGQLETDGHAKWIAKPELSHAGRNRLIMSGQNFNSQQAGWLRRHFARGEAVSVEPWVDVQFEGSMHFEISSDFDRAVTEIGITGLLNDSVGRYRGSFRPIELGCYEGCGDLKQSLMMHGGDICERMRQAGYWGPVGLDFFVYKDSGGQLYVRLSNDLNARWTMGRLSLEIAERVGAKGAFRWEHFATGNSVILEQAIQKGLTESGGQSVDILRTSPEHVGGRNVRLGNVAIWASGSVELESQTLGSQAVDQVAEKIRSSVQDLVSEKSSQ